MNKLFNGTTHVTAAILLLAALPAEAYIGPGLGAGTLGVILGLLALRVKWKRRAQVAA